VKTAPNLTVGYIMGSGDQVPPVLEQSGARVEQLGPDGLAWGDLSRFDTIVIGIRAYERREDLARQQPAVCSSTCRTAAR
jgi:hypothetical protein